MVSCVWLNSTGGRDTERDRVLNVFVDFEQLKEE